jgi:DNA-binding LacI/PurR family transcriptional regulator
MADLPSHDVTITDIAREAGVSTATLSCVLDNHPYVAEATLLRAQQRVPLDPRRLGFAAENLSVTGFGDVPSSATLQPSLTTVHQPLHEMERMAARIVVALANHQEGWSRQIELPTQLIVRESCCAPRPPSWNAASSFL